jgi:5'-nucleotidase/UDP-sugar diphosphatase
MKNIFARLLLFTLLLLCSTFIVAQEAMDTITIISFNDFHGKFIADKEVPGAAALVGRVNALRKNAPHPIVVSGGDNFSGDFFTRITRAKLLKTMFEKMDVEMTALGNHEFDWGQPFLKDTLGHFIPLISDNITDDNGQTPSWMKPYRIVERTLRDGKPFRIAFIGLTTVTTAGKTQTGNLKGLHFTDPVGATEREVLSDIRREGQVDLIVIVMHIGTDMAYPYRIIESDADMIPFVPGISAIVSAHSHKLVLDKINNVPVIQACCYGKAAAALYFQVRTHRGIRDISFIKGDTLTVHRSDADASMQKAIDDEAKSYGFYDVLTTSKDVMLHDVDVNYRQYTAPGAYISASYEAAYRKNHPTESRPVIGANHFRGIRDGIPKGPVTYLHASNLLPFGGNVIAYRFTGATLAELLTCGRLNKAGYLQTAHLKMKVDKNDKVIALWYNGQAIRPEEECIVVTDSYIAPGNDGYQARWFNAPLEVLGTTSNLFTAYLRTLPYISIKNAPLPVVVR